MQNRIVKRILSLLISSALAISPAADIRAAEKNYDGAETVYEEHMTTEEEHMIAEPGKSGKPEELVVPEESVTEEQTGGSRDQEINTVSEKPEMTLNEMKEGSDREETEAGREENSDGEIQELETIYAVQEAETVIPEKNETAQSDPGTSASAPNVQEPVRSQEMKEETLAEETDAPAEQENAGDTEDVSSEGQKDTSEEWSEDPDTETLGDSFPEGKMETEPEEVIKESEKNIEEKQTGISEEWKARETESDVPLNETESDIKREEDYRGYWFYRDERGILSGIQMWNGLDISDGIQLELREADRESSSSDNIAVLLCDEAVVTGAWKQQPEGVTLNLSGETVFLKYQGERLIYEKNGMEYELERDENGHVTLHTEGIMTIMDGETALSGETDASDVRITEMERKLEELGYQEPEYQKKLISADVFWNVPGIYYVTYEVTEQASRVTFRVSYPVILQEKDKNFIEAAEPDTDEKDYYTVIPMPVDSVKLAFEKTEYRSGETVEFTVEPDAEVDSVLIEAEAKADRTDGISEKGQDISVEVAGKSEESQNEEHLQHAEPETYFFVMPEADVEVSATAEYEITAAAVPAAENGESAIPDKFYMQVSGTCYAPGSLNRREAGTTYKTVKYIVDGEEVVRMAYCMEPRASSPGSQYYEKDQVQVLSDDQAITKALYYLYGGPAWGKNIGYSDGSQTVNLKNIMTEAGCTTKEHYYAITHFILSYLYVGAGGNWNYNSNNPNVLNSAGVTLVKTVVGHLKKMPKPAAAITKKDNIVSDITAKYDRKTEKFVTESIIYRAVEENTATVTFPSGVELVNDETETRKTGKVTLNGMDQFHLEITHARASETAKYDKAENTYTINLNLKTKYSVDFEAYKMQLAGHQDIGFSYYAGEKTLPLEVEWTPGDTFVEIQKLNADSNKASVPNAGYSLAGAVYGIYSDKACQNLLKRMVTRTDGSSRPVSIDPGNYYVKEISPSKNFGLDENVYAVEVLPDKTATVESKEPPFKGKIQVIKINSETGSQDPGLDGTRFDICRDKDGDDVVQTLTIKDGQAVSKKLYYGTYYLRETYAPDGFIRKKTPVRVSLNAETDNHLESVTAENDPEDAYGAIRVEKIDALTGTSEATEGYSTDGAVYIVYSDQACTKELEELVIKNGFAQTSEEELYKVGETYYVKEVSAPIGYELDPEVYKAVITEEITAEVPYVITSSETPARVAISILKRDSETGTTVPSNSEYPLAGAQYGIYTSAGCAEDSRVEVLTIGSDSRAVSARRYLAGTYYVREIMPPPGYQKDEGIYAVNITARDAEAGKTYIVESSDQPQGKIAVEKHDRDTGTKTPMNQNYSMDGAQYTIYQDKNCTQPVETLTISSGEALSGELSFGTYYVKETKAPDKYDMDSEIYKAEVGAASMSDPVKIISEDPAKRGKISIRKYEAETGKSEPYTKALSFQGAVFGIYRRETCREEELIEKIVTDQNGYAESSELFIDNYFLKEITPPVGYQPNMNVFPVTAREMADAVSDNSRYVNVEVEEQIIRADVMLMKYLDKDTGSGVQTDREKLEGIGFRFTYVDDPAVTFLLEGDQENQIFTDKNGIATTENRERYPHGTLIYGKWLIEEFHTPEGYEGLKAAVIEITEDGEIYPYVVANNLFRANVRIEKHDLNTGELIPAAGVEFKVKDTRGNYVKLYDHHIGKYTEVFVTRSDGIVELPNTIGAGEYILEEIRPPEGYGLANPVSFTVNQDYSDPLVPLVIECWDAPQLGNIEINKRDADTGQACGRGFVFEILAAEDISDLSGTVRTGENADGKTVSLVKGTVVDRITTDENGRAVSKDLYLGHYTVKEIASAQYYAIDLTEYPAELGPVSNQEKASAQVRVKNRKTFVELSKVDAYDSLKVLPGSSFRIFTEEEVEEKRIERYNEELNAFQKNQAEEKDIFFKEQEKKYAAFLDAQEKALQTCRDEGHTEEEVAKLLEAQAAEKELFEAQKIAEEETMNAAWDTEYKAFLIKLKAELKIDLKTVGKEYVSDKNGYIRIENLKHDKKYYLIESEKPDGYNLDQTIHVIETDENGLIAGKESAQLIIGNIPNIVQISKQDITDGEELPGARLTVTDEDGKVVEEWISEETPHVIMGLPAGEYILTEVCPPEYYCTAESIRFAVSDSLEVQQVSMTDQPVLVEIKKLDADTGKLLEGAELIVLNEKGKEVVRFTTVAEASEILNLPVGSYTLIEAKAPAGYVTMGSIPFKVTDSKELQTVIMIDRKTEIEISKQAVTGGEELPGARMEIRNESGEITASWISGQQPYRISGLPIGTYTLTEVSAPDGYSIAETISFEICDTEEIQRVTMYDHPTELVIYKKDIMNSEEIPGAELIVTDNTGKVIDRWISEKEPHRIAGLTAGEYILTEITAPDGYATAESVRFVISDRLEVHQISMQDVPIVVEISKIAEDTGEALPNAALQLLNGEGKVIDEWISTEEVHRLMWLPVGNYTLLETRAPEGYSIAEPLVFEVTDTEEIQKVVITDTKIIVDIYKMDQAGNGLLEGAELLILNEKGEEIKRFTTSSEKPVRVNLPAGEYLLAEAEAPEGYTTAESLMFKVTDESGVQEVRMYDRKTELEISKQDITNSKEISGAELILKNQEGQVVESWISGQEPHRISGLLVGEYTLTEITAPDGYEVAETVRFSVEDTLEIQHVTMYDRPKTETEKETETEEESETEDETMTETEAETEQETEQQTKENDSLPVPDSGEKPSSPKTGDETPVILYLLLFGAAGFIMTGSVYRNICKKRKAGKKG